MSKKSHHLNTKPENQRPKNLQNNSRGKIGESIACEYLLKKHFHIIERNYSKRYGEIDIIAIDGDTLVFVEVKTRMNSKFGLPEEAVTPRKLRDIEQTGMYYISDHPTMPKHLRIDVIAIELFPDNTVRAIRHITNVT